jgi:hypothetical protein
LARSCRRCRNPNCRTRKCRTPPFQNDESYNSDFSLTIHRLHKSPGSYPTTLSFNASVVKIYRATNSIHSAFL